MISGNMGFMDLRQQYCCLRSIKLHIALITGPYLYNINLLPVKIHYILFDLKLIASYLKKKINIALHIVFSASVCWLWLWLLWLLWLLWWYCPTSCLCMFTLLLWYCPTSCLCMFTFCCDTALHLVFSDSVSSLCCLELCLRTFIRYIG